MRSSFFFFNDTATTEIYTLSLHDALPIYALWCRAQRDARNQRSLLRASAEPSLAFTDRKSTRLNSSHRTISYAVFCLKKKKKTQYPNKREYQNKRRKSYTYSSC